MITRKYTIVSIILILCLCVSSFFMLEIREHLVLPFTVNQTSMTPTLCEGDKIIIDRLIYRFNEPQKGDIVVFSRDKDTKITYVKRIIATAGDEVKLYGGSVYINGEIKYEDYCIGITDAGYAGDTFLIPEGEVFLMGDNRIDSLDSRDFGCISIKNILGKVSVKVWPYEAIETYK